MDMKELDKLAEKLTAEEAYAVAAKAAARDHARRALEARTDDVDDALVERIVDGLGIRPEKRRVARLSDSVRQDIFNRVMQECGAKSPFVEARVELKAYTTGGYTETVKEVRFDCSSLLDEFSMKDLPEHAADLQDEGALNFGDDIFEAAQDAGLVDWDGPLDLFIDDEEEYSGYLDARREREGIGGEAR